MVAIQEYPLLIDCDIFMETLLSSIKNAVSSYQHFISKTKGAKKLKILDRIAAMKKDPNHNQAALSIAERELDKIIDQEVRIAVEKSPLFDHINNEKMSPLFLKLAKSCNSEYRLNDIVGSDGVIFNCEADRKEYIVSYFEKIYKKPDYTPDNVAGIIENFLGPDILRIGLTLPFLTTAASRFALNPANGGVSKGPATNPFLTHVAIVSVSKIPFSVADLELTEFNGGN